MLRFIINPHSRSGKGKKIWENLKSLLPQDLIYQQFFTEYPGHGSKLAAQLTKEKEEPAPIVTIMGGDGSLNEALNGFHMENAPVLGYLPTGSGNDFARGMKLPADPAQALAHILNPKYFYQLDYGAVCYGDKARPASRRFLVSCGMGYDAAVCHQMNQTKIKKLLNAVHMGKISYLIIGIQQIIHCRFTDGTLKVDKQASIPLKNIAFISCHNLPYEGGGFPFAPGAKVDDGYLDLCIVTAKSRLRFTAVLFTAMLGGRHTRLNGVKLIRCREASLRLNAPLPLHTDGEVLGFYYGMEITCHPRELPTVW
ncbi:diacylglycerol/lipid kinase family protein [Hominifimenecus sp. rT4P-3]|uniref:diacylglycerol/lipid kinase family protein n=1 Tax=Hominifimenecus sp. rT4P-3 TaxID=3242979 RepID=UPI003DA2302B